MYPYGWAFHRITSDCSKAARRRRLNRFWTPPRIQTPGIATTSMLYSFSWPQRNSWSMRLTSLNGGRLKNSVAVLLHKVHGRRSAPPEYIPPITNIFMLAALRIHERVTTSSWPSTPLRQAPGLPPFVDYCGLLGE